MTDKTIKCKDCGKDFVLSIGEQRFYESKELSFPIRCKDCRNTRKIHKDKVNKDLVSKPSLTQDEIDAILAKWKENTIYFEKEETCKTDLYNRHNSTTKRRK
jgi:DNA-directed RNA polymerase subunit RPC12/RpoP